MTHRIQKLEHISLRAWQALNTHSYDGWLLRYAKGYTGRANSVQVLDRSSRPLDEKIAYCENWYSERDLPCIFRLTEAMQPPSLEDELEHRNYERYNETLVQTASLTEQVFEPNEQFHYQSSVTDRWLSAWARWNHVPEVHIATAEQMLSQQTLASCYGWVDDVAVGLAVVDNNHVGLFDIVVAPEARRKGIGRILVCGLLRWAKIHLAKTAYLQVTSVNEPAKRLYDTLGFTTHHHYWYRRQP